MEIIGVLDAPFGIVGVDSDFELQPEKVIRIKAIQINLHPIFLIGPSFVDALEIKYILLYLFPSIAPIMLIYRTQNNDSPDSIIPLDYHSPSISDVRQHLYSLFAVI
jgi:hypothetical protein